MMRRTLAEVLAGLGMMGAMSRPCAAQDLAQISTDAGSGVPTANAGKSADKSPANQKSSAADVSEPNIIVSKQLDQKRQQIVPSLGAVDYSITQADIDHLTEGGNIPFDKLVLRFPGVTQDSEGSGSFHIRDEHGNVQYRINDVLIPEGITGFDSDFDTRFADRVDLITGALPAQYGLRTSGILDIHTKSGVYAPGGDVEMYGGSNGEIRPSFEYGGSDGKLSYYFSGSYLQDNLGIENPTSSSTAIHDHTDQYRGFAYLSYTIDDTSRLSLIAGEAYNQFEIPNSPGQSPAVDGTGTPFVIPGAATFNSADLNEQQREQNNFAVLAYQKTLDDFDFQLALFNRYSQVNFSPDQLGDLYFNGVAGQLERSIMSNGVQFDSSYHLNDSHTIRGGLILNAQGGAQNSDTTVIPLDPATGAQAGAPFSVADHDYETADSFGFYLQDEWKVTKQFTINFGGRFDEFISTDDRQNQLSPRLNLTYQFDRNTTAHAGYASYFTPPPLENVPPGAVTAFANTTNAATPGLPDGPVRAERAQYFDTGIVHSFTPAYQVGIDGYYKIAQNLIDDGQFGAAPILSAFNYQHGQIGGVEVTQNYTQGPFSAYANFAMEEGIGAGWNSAQSVLFNAQDYAYVQNHYIYLDHSQSFTGSLGASYRINETRPYVEMVCGSGLRADIDGVPNGGSIPAYDSVNIGVEQTFRFLGPGWDNLSARVDIVNVFDQTYELRDGSGVGVFAPQFGQRRGFYGGLKYSF
jgi:outer membrane receptor protein involved in Fe transport